MLEIIQYNGSARNNLQQIYLILIIIYRQIDWINNLTIKSQLKKIKDKFYSERIYNCNRISFQRLILHQ